MAWTHRIGHPLIAAVGAWAVGSVAWAGLHDPIETTPGKLCKVLAGAPVVSEASFTDLQEKGFVVMDAGLSQAQLSAARQSVAQLFQDGHKPRRYDNQDDVRTDLVTWVQAKELRQTDEIGGSDNVDKLKGLDSCIDLLRGLAAELDASDVYNRSSDHESPINVQVHPLERTTRVCYRNRLNTSTTETDTLVPYSRSHATTETSRSTLLIVMLRHRLAGQHQCGIWV